MKLVLKLIIWGLRAYVFFAFPGGGSAIVIVELIASGLGLLRLEQDQIFENITGFVGNNNVGYYSVKDNLGNRVIGWLSWLVAMGLRGLLFSIAIGATDPNSLTSSEPVLSTIVQFFL